MKFNWKSRLKSIGEMLKIFVAYVVFILFLKAKKMCSLNPTFDDVATLLVFALLIYWVFKIMWEDIKRVWNEHE
jgi:hypothetical protein